MRRKQLITLIVCGALAVALIPVYFFGIRPLLADEEEQEEMQELLPGEMRDGVSNRILLFPYFQRPAIYSIEVHNEHGTFRYLRGDENEFYAEGMQNAPYDLEGIASLVVSAGRSLAITRLEDKSDDLSVYGLNEGGEAAWYELTAMNGNKYKVYIGKMIPTGAGYYARYEGRDAVYVLSTSICTPILSDVCTFITPSLGYPLPSTGVNSLDDFVLMKQGNRFLEIDALTPEETGRTDGVNEYVLKHPAGYDINSAAQSSLIGALGAITGTETVRAGIDMGKMDPADFKAVLAEYDIHTEAPYYLLSYVSQKVTTMLFFSEPDENGDMYAYSNVFSLIAKINISSLSFLKWDLLEYVEPALFAENINDVAKIEIEGALADEGLAVNAFFTIEGSGTNLVIKKNGEGLPLDADGVENFRSYYMVLLAIRLRGQTDVSDPERMEFLAKMTVTLDDGTVTEYGFYSYSTRRCFYTVNGKGEFYVNRDDVAKALRDTDRVLKGQPVDYQGKN